MQHTCYPSHFYFLVRWGSNPQPTTSIPLLIPLEQLLRGLSLTLESMWLTALKNHHYRRHIFKKIIQDVSKLACDYQLKNAYNWKINYSRKNIYQLFIFFFFWRELTNYLSRKRFKNIKVALYCHFSWQVGGIHVPLFISKLNLYDFITYNFWIYFFIPV